MAFATQARLSNLVLKTILHSVMFVQFLLKSPSSIQEALGLVLIQFICIIRRTERVQSIVFKRKAVKPQQLKPADSVFNALAFQVLLQQSD